MDITEAIQAEHKSNLVRYKDLELMLPEGHNFITTTSYGSIRAYKEKPYIKHDTWVGGPHIELKIIDTEIDDWRDTLEDYSDA